MTKEEALAELAKAEKAITQGRMILACPIPQDRRIFVEQMYAKLITCRDMCMRVLGQ